MKHLFLLAIVTSAASLPAAAAPLYLYDGAQSGTPDTQGWLTTDFDTSLQSPGIGHTTVDTTADLTDLFMYYTENINTSQPYNPSLPTFSDAQGFTVSFTGNMVSEAHGPNGQATDSNAGWSLLVTASNDFGIQIAFQDNLIYSLNGSLVEDTNNTASFNNLGSHTYDLHIVNGTYALTVDQNAIPILTGSTMDFSSIAPPYGYANLVLLGDTSNTASVQYQLSSVTVTVPEPALLCGLVMGLFALTRRTRRTS